MNPAAGPHPERYECDALDTLEDIPPRWGLEQRVYQVIPPVDRSGQKKTKFFCPACRF
jgi:hypothetical protein